MSLQKVLHLVTGTSADEKGQMIGYWVSEMLKKPIHPPYSAMGWLNQRNSLVGAALFNDFYPNGNVEATIYGPGALTRVSLAQGFNYAFNQLGCSRLTVKCNRRNVRMRKLYPRVGFNFEGTMARYFGPDRGDDALVFRITRDNAEKWMKPNG